MSVVASLKSRLLSSERAWPAYARHWARRTVYAVGPLVLAGDGRVCPCCDGHFRRFTDFRGPGWTIPDTRCPRCGSMGRQRVLWLYLERETDLLTRPARLLQFAPDWASYRRLSRMPRLDYVTGDIRDSPLITTTMDITDIPLPDATVDVVFCSHVLEHVPDDRGAMREIRRVLKPSGVAFLQHPIVKGQAITDEDPEVVDPQERVARWGQADHVRAYGADHYDRLAQAGFAVEVVPYHERLSAEEVERYRVAEDSTSRSQDIAVCRPAESGSPSTSESASPSASVSGSPSTSASVASRPQPRTS